VGSSLPSGKVFCAGRLVTVRIKVNARRGRWMGMGRVLSNDLPTVNEMAVTQTARCFLSILQGIDLSESEDHAGRP
jgi:hypothetical protein